MAVLWKSEAFKRSLIGLLPAGVQPRVGVPALNTLAVPPTDFPIASSLAARGAELAGSAPPLLLAGSPAPSRLYVCH